MLVQKHARRSESLGTLGRLAKPAKKKLSKNLPEMLRNLRRLAGPAGKLANPAEGLAEKGANL